MTRSLKLTVRTKEIDGKAAPDADWTAIAQSWVAVNLALATAARFRFEEEDFQSAPLCRIVVSGRQSGH